MTFLKSLPDLPGTKEWIFFGKAPYLMAVGQLLKKVIQTHKTLQIHWKDSNFGDKYDRKWLKYLFLGFDRKNLTGTFSNRLRLISLAWLVSNHDDVIKWSYFPRYWPFVRGNSPVPSEFPAQRPVTRSLDVFFDLHLNKRLSKQSSSWWFETLFHPLWRHRNDIPGAHNVHHT